MKRVVRLFAGLPVLLYHMSSQDFLQFAGLPESTKAYDSLGVDRIATLAGARHLCPNASSHMVLDGGTAFTYTTILDKSVCGGINIGLRIRLEVLKELQEDVVSIPSRTAMENLVKDLKKPIPLMKREDHNTSLVKTAVQEMSLLLSTILENFLARFSSSSKSLSKLPVIFVCGGDGQLIFHCLKSPWLNPKASSGHFAPRMADYSSLTTAPSDKSKRYALICNDALIHHGIQSLLSTQQKKQSNSTAQSQLSSLRAELLGQRVLLQPTPSSNGKQQEHTSSGYIYQIGVGAKAAAAVTTATATPTNQQSLPTNGDATKLENDTFLVYKVGSNQDGPPESLVLDLEGLHSEFVCFCFRLFCVPFLRFTQANKT